MFSILIPSKVTLRWGKDFLQVTGPLGTVTKEKGDLTFAINNNRLYILANEEDPNRHFYLALLRSIFLGVSKGYRKKLRLVGVGFRASKIGKNLVLKIGYSHEVHYPLPDDVEILCGKNKGILLFLRGKEFHRVSQVAAEIRALRFPDVYKGKGIHYDKERLILKKGKREGK